MTSDQLINQTSGNVEIHTPTTIVEAARAALGGRIDLDPASSAVANERVKAYSWFGMSENGLRQHWDCGTLWMNHPFSRAHNRTWIMKFIDSFERGRIRDAACCITFASTSEEWFRPLLDHPQCFLWPRTNYLKPDGSIYRGVTKGSVVTYLGRDVALFREAFKGLGTVKV